MRTDQRQEVRGNGLTADGFGQVDAGEIVSYAGHQRHARKDLVPRAPIEEIGVGDADRADAGMNFVQDDQPAGIGVGQGSQQRAIDEGENRRVRANGEREREEGHAGEAGILAERPKAVAQVLAERFESANAAGIAAFLRDLIGAAEIEANAAACFFWREARLNMLFELAIEVEPEFLIQAGIHRLGAEDRAQTEEQIAEHSDPQASPSTWLTATVNCFQRPVSVSSCLGPALVSS